MPTELKLPTVKTQATTMDVPMTPNEFQQAAGRTIVAYGDSGLAKTTNAGFFAQYEYEKTGKPGRLISVEDSSKIIFEPLIQLGIVEPLFLSRSQHPLVAMRKLAAGKWPRFSKGGTVEWITLEDAYGDRFGFLIVEGLTTIAEGLLEETREEHRFLREQKADSFELGGEKFGTASQTAFGFVQMEMLRHLKGFGALPVDRVLWTAHESKGVEESSKAPIRGPGIVGSAATDKVQKYCSLMLHFDGVTNKQTGAVTPRVWYRRHPDPQFPNIYYPAKTTIPSERLPELEKDYPGGFFDPTPSEGLDKFLATEAQLVAAATDHLRQWKEKVDKARAAA